MRQAPLSAKASGLQNPRIELTPLSEVNYLPLMDLLLREISVHLCLPIHLGRAGRVETSDIRLREEGERAGEEFFE